MTRRWRRLLVYWGPAVLFMALIFSISHIRIGRLGAHGFTHADKVAHATEYALLCLLVFRALRGAHRNWLCQWAPLAALGLASLYAATDEWHQSFVGRECDVMDWIADTFGAALTAAICWAWMRAHADPRENRPPEEW